MATVPRVSTPTVQQQVVSQPRAQRVDVSSGLREIGSAAEYVADAYEKFNTRLDTTAAEDALVQFEREKNDLFFNTESGYFNTQGRNAVDNADATSKSLSEIAARYGDTLKSPQARQLFDKAVKTRIVRDEQSILSHASKGQKVWESATLAAQQENAIENASLYWSNDEELTISRLTGRQSVIDQADVEGVTGQALAERLQTYESSFTRATIVSALESGDLSRAESLFSKHEKSLEGTDKVAVQKLITAETDKRYILGKVDSIYSPDKDLSEMMTEARQEKDPDKRSEIERQVRNMHTIEKAARDERISESYNDMAVQLERGDVSYLELPPEKLEELDPAQRKNLRAIEDARISGNDTVTDWDYYNNLIMLPDEKLKGVNPADHFGKLAKGERQKLITAVKSAKGGTGDRDLTFGRSQSTALTETAKQIFGKKPMPEQVNAFNRLVREQAIFEGVENMVQFEELLSRMATKVVKEREFWFDTETSLRDIPTEYVGDLAAELRRSGKEVNPANMNALYELAKSKGLLK